MPDHFVPASFGADESVVATGERGQRAHHRQFEHRGRLERRLYEVAEGVWCLVGNGLSNQTFVEGPEGLVAIDTGESVEEMAAALREVRVHTSAPVVAVLYTHHHYCNGTQAVFDEAGGPVPVWAHADVEDNLRSRALEQGPTAARGMVHQFAMLLPDDGPDGRVQVGLGLEYRLPEHAPYTHGFVAPSEVVAAPTTTTLAGLRVDLVPAPSDADDNLNVFFPDLDLCVNNLAWPALFNVFPIRGEPYRDPRVLLRGFDGILAAAPEHLLCAHGPPLSGRDAVREAVTGARDAVQFLWDQTVRGVNRGLTHGELVEFVQLPDHCDDSYLTRQNYGLVEHHVRQVHTGLVGWFDGFEASLFPLPTAERCRRLVEGFGGRDEVAARARAALVEDDLRWALELATWPVRAGGGAHGGTEAERSLLAEVLRAIGQRTTSANVRGWCLTRARDLEGLADLDRHRLHRFGRGQVLAADPASVVAALRVLLDPEPAAGVDDHLRWRVATGDGESTCGLWVRNRVAVPTDGSGAELEVAMDHGVLADVLSVRCTMAEAVGDGSVVATGDASRIAAVLACFEVSSLGI